MIANKFERSTVRRMVGGALAVVGSIALVLAGVSPSVAADYRVGPSDIPGYGPGEGGPGIDPNHSLFWYVANTHELGTAVEESLDFGECGGRGVIFLDPISTDFLPNTTLEMLEYNDHSMDPVEQTERILSSLEIEIGPNSSFAVSLSLWQYDDSGGVSGGWLHQAVPFTEEGLHAWAADTALDAYNFPGSIPVPGTVAELQQYVSNTFADSGEGVYLEGIRIEGAPGSELRAVSFNGDNYEFAAAECEVEAPVAQQGDSNTAGAADSKVTESPKKPVRVETGA